MGMKKDETMIRIKRKTIERLRELGKYGDSYDRIINRLIDEREKLVGKE
jgi:uncharacterized protein (UPF0371 family)